MIHPGMGECDIRWAILDINKSHVRSQVNLVLAPS